MPCASVQSAAFLDGRWWEAPCFEEPFGAAQVSLHWRGRERATKGKASKQDDGVFFPS